MGAQPLDNNYKPVAQNLYDPVGVQFVSPLAGSVKTGSDNTSYAPTVHQISTNNTGLPVNTPVIVQKANNVSTGSVATLAKAFGSNNTAGNTIIVVCGCGNGTAMTVADSAGNTYTQAVTAPNSTTFEAAIFYAVGIIAGANTVTVTNAGTAASMAMEIYEVSGLLAQVVAQPDQSSTGTGTGTTASTSALAASSPNSLAFLGVGVGTAAQAVSVTSGTNWTLDSTQNSGGTAAGLFTFGALSQYIGNTSPVVPKATIASSEPWAAAAAIFKPVVIGVQGTVNLGGYNYTNVTSKTTTVAKIGPGILRAIVINAPGTSDTLTIYDNTAASGTKIGTVTVTAGYPLVYDVNFSTGLTVVSGGSTAGDYTIVWR
jgi:hypothetical protein